MKLKLPLDKIHITQKFGERPDVYKQFNLKGHNGVDFRTRFIDSPLGRRYVTAAADGVVEVTRADFVGYGVHVRLRHPDGSMTIYGHLTRSYVNQKQSVKTGQRIGLTGSTGFSSAPHLHFEYRPTGWERNRQNGYAGAVDPMQYIL